MRAGSMEEEDGWKNIGCATRLLQLAVNMALEDVLSMQKALASARRLLKLATQEVRGFLLIPASTTACFWAS